MSSILTLVKSWQKRDSRIDKNWHMQIEDAGVEYRYGIRARIDETRRSVKGYRKPALLHLKQLHRF